MAAAARGRGGPRRGEARGSARAEKGAARRASSRPCRQRSTSAPAPWRRKHAERTSRAALAARAGPPASRSAETCAVHAKRQALRGGCGSAGQPPCPSTAQQMERGYDGACTERDHSPLRPAHRGHAPETAAGYEHRGEYRRDGGRRDDRGERDRRRSSSRDRSPKRSRRESPYRGGRGRDDGQYGAWQRLPGRAAAASRCSECVGTGTHQP